MSSVKQQTGATENLVRVSAEMLSTVAPSSREQMIEHGTRFVQFVHSKNTKVDLRTIDERAVNEYLRFFYFTLRTKQDKLYSPSSLICIRAGIQRYFDVVLGRPLILPGNPVFMTSNRMLGQRAREYASSSGSSVRHYAPMLHADRQLLEDYFNGSSAGGYSMEERLQDGALFALFYHFGCTPSQHQQRHNQQAQQKLIRRDHLVFSIDEEGREFATLEQDEGFYTDLTPGGTSRNACGSVRMYTGLEQLKSYINLLPEFTNDNSLFPKPARNGRGYSTSINRGINYMQNFMRYVSKKARLSKLYSNHCIRLTRIRDLSQSGLSANEIRLVTGLKCSKSVRRCLKWSSADAAVTAASPSSAANAVEDIPVDDFGEEFQAGIGMEFQTDFEME
ncbi:hypothetical protein BOX15_Mlig029737g1 [Macrostomum lignano]|uniref:Uncharacterized protein n=2 Tax=Macrostomum lignano TaxID=282301 RepID=A0A267GSK0_9PLAT|nr:hypothetical protein BOX15_Mlig029737g1 [Macrostomum lignano]